MKALFNKIKDWFKKLDLKKLIKETPGFRQKVALVLCPIATFYLFEFYSSNPFEQMYFGLIVTNLIYFELFAFILFFLTKRIRFTLMFETGFFAVIGLINYFVLQFRSNPIMPWDILSIGTALSVADNYKYTVETHVIVVIAGFVLLLILEFFMKYKAQFNWKKRTIGTVSTLVLTYGFIILTSQPFFATNMGMYVKLFQPVVMQKQDGGVLAFIYETQFMKVKTPDGYDKTAAETALLDYEDKEDTTSAAKTTEDKKLPNIIVIMDETFSDLRVLGDFSTTRPVTPYIDSILAGTDNTISGKVNVSVLGGNTPNSEYEFLTSNSMAFLPQGSIPYQQYITGKTPTLVSYLDDMGYKTVAIHPFNAPGWDRDRVYPLLSFDEMYFINDFILPEKIRKYVSDAESFRKVEKMYETKEEGEPLFVFNVTMQNHSSFNVKYDGYNPDISVLGTKSYQLSNYLTLTNYTDNAVKDLIDYFSKVDEDTIIVFFGDHQPNDDVGKPILKKLGKDPDNLSVEDNANRYITPFFIWANYDIEGTTGVKEESGLDSSLNYLAPRALQAAGLPLTDYMKYVQTVEKEYPVISAIQVKDKDGNSYSVDDKLSDLNEYAKLAYYRLFDTQVKVTKEEETTAEQSTVDANANK